jgi:hypothetical protein
LALYSAEILKSQKIFSFQILPATPFKQAKGGGSELAAAQRR